MLLREFVEVRDVPDEGFVVELLYGRVSCNHVHSLAAEEVYQTSFDLGRTAGLVGTEGLCFLFVPYERCAAVRAVLGEVRQDYISFASAEFDSGDLWYDLSSFFDIDVVSDVDVKEFHLVCIVE